MRALLIALFLVPACAGATDVRFHALSSTFTPSPTGGRVDVFIANAPAKPFRVVGVIVVTPKYDLRKAARLAGETAQTLGCDLVTMSRNGEIARAATSAPIRVASLGGSFSGWGSGNGWSDRNNSPGYEGAQPTEDKIDPRMRKFWCGVYEDARPAPPNPWEIEVAVAPVRALLRTPS